MRTIRSTGRRRSMWLLGVAASSYVLACRARTANPAALAPRFTTIDSLRCGGLNRHAACVLYDVSIDELLANPLLYDGKRVRLVGFAHFEFERNALYPHREDWQQSILSNGLWMDPPPHADSLSGHYVIVEARFVARNRGHLGLWSGALDSVTRLERWERPLEPPRRYKIIEAPKPH